MADSDASTGLVACKECGALRSIHRSDDADNCQECGNDSVTDIPTPSEM